MFSFTVRGLYFYPNPLISKGKLTTNGEVLESFHLFSIDGRLIREYSHLNTFELTIDKSGLSEGFYFYSTLLRNGQMTSGKIVVQ
ncbi:MAG: T9SS type A sorting domain-containing protein [Bacteroidetes bacterium]|nr:T9SS type A sorting domain-containing protein [Bacteroidota bacterium]